MFHLVKIDPKRTEGGDKDIDSEVKLEAPDEQRLINVLLNNSSMLLDG